MNEKASCIICNTSSLFRSTYQLQTCKCTPITIERILLSSKRDSRGLGPLRVVLLLIVSLLVRGLRIFTAEDLDAPTPSRIRLTWVSMVNLTTVLIYIISYLSEITKPLVKWFLITLQSNRDQYLPTISTMLKSFTFCITMLITKNLPPQKNTRLIT